MNLTLTIDLKNKQRKNRDEKIWRIIFAILEGMDDEQLQEIIVSDNITGIQLAFILMKVYELSIEN